MMMWRLHASPAAAAAVSSNTSWISTLSAAFHANPIGFMTSVAMCVGAIALAGLLIAAIPALVSLKKTMDSAHVLLESLEEELPDAVAAIKLSGLEMADAMEEVSGLGSDLTAGIRASARALVGAETGVRQGAHMASGAITKSLPTAKVAAEQALQKRASMTYSKDTVADVAKATKVASKRLRTALVAAQWAQNANRFLGP
ncbi:hypothetical protein M9435_001281 [Picochlorum sp. BPE23]|nr:hypothetical protein M9435_001281 [Picochlorum sp. BPE23]